MALKKTGDGAPKFEDDTGGVVDAPKVANPASAAQASTAVAKASASSRAVAAGGGFKSVYGVYRDQMPPLDYDSVPRIVGSNGQMKAKMVGKDVVLGSKIDFTLLSFNDNFTISPGDDSDEARTKVRYSRDGKTIDSTGGLVADYVAQLKAEGFEKASVKQYAELIGIVDQAEKGKELEGSLVVVSLSPKSVAIWNGHQGQTSVDILLGKRKLEDGVDKLQIAADVRTQGKNDFTLLVVSIKK